MKDVLVPFLKWAGGKRWLFTDSFVKGLPHFNRYIEPFLGGGAGFFAVRPAKAILADINAELIELYCTVRDHPSELSDRLAIHQRHHCEDYYYNVRASVPNEQIERAARMLYLNRTCWNGLYRLNRKGLFNVPIGTKTAVSLPSDNFQLMSERLRCARIFVSDFEVVVDQASFGDLLFVDPPYTVRHNLNGFVKYNEKIFSWSDQIRLGKAVRRAALRGASVIVTNADHSSVRDLYLDTGQLEVVHRASVISGNKSGRSQTTELIVRL